MGEKEPSPTSSSVAVGDQGIRLASFGSARDVSATPTPPRRLGSEEMSITVTVMLFGMQQNMPGSSCLGVQ